MSDLSGDVFHYSIKCKILQNCALHMYIHVHVLLRHVRGDMGGWGEVGGAIVEKQSAAQVPTRCRAAVYCVD